MPRAKLAPKDIPDFFNETEPARRASGYDGKYERHTYRVAGEMHAELKQISAGSGVGLNDLVRWVFAQFITAHNEGELELPVEQYVTTVSRLSE